MPPVISKAAAVPEMNHELPGTSIYITDPATLMPSVLAMPAAVGAPPAVIVDLLPQVRYAGPATIQRTRNVVAPSCVSGSTCKAATPTRNVGVIGWKVVSMLTCRILVYHSTMRRASTAVGSVAYLGSVCRVNRRRGAQCACPGASPSVPARYLRRRRRP